jgi:DNA polymerase-3 subunit delta
MKRIETKQKQMAVQKNNTDYTTVVKAIAAGDIKPVYFLMGEESYYIDRISDYIVDTVLKEEERDFNLTVMYGADIHITDVLDAASRYPMMADRQVVVVKEAQALKSELDGLLAYLKAPSPTTVLVFCYKNGTIDMRKKVAGEIDKAGVLFHSKKLRDTQLPDFIVSYLKRKQVGIDRKTTMVIAESVGTDLLRLVSELDKLVLALPADNRTVTADLVERCIGVSKDYNIFELRDALIARDVLKANKILKYFDKNPKACPIQAGVAALFNFFSQLMLAYYAPDKSERGVAAWLDLKNAWMVTPYMEAMKKYSGVKTMQIISELRKTDAKSKGIDSPATSDGELFRELVYFILH